jgi:membrane protein YdbS with pleckstrin-like domain
MNSIYKPLILAVVVGLYVYIVSKSENSVILNFVILYIIITIVYLLFRKIEKKRKRVRRR